MNKKQTTSDLIHKALEDWNLEEMFNFIRDIQPILTLYDVDPEDDWLEKEVGKDDCQTVRLIRTVYLISKLAENHAGKLCRLAYRHPMLYKKLEKSLKDHFVDFNEMV
jgi:hypothetical protein